MKIIFRLCNGFTTSDDGSIDIRSVDTKSTIFTFLDIEIDKLYLYNKYEGSRVGLGLSTNDKLSKYFSVGGFFAYGFDDEESKYGGNLEINLDRYNEVKLKFFYHSDL